MMKSKALIDFNWNIKICAKFLKRQIKTLDKNWILGRYACLGGEILKRVTNNPFSVNIQKGRVDYLLNCIDDADMKTRARQVVPFLKQEDIIPLIIQEEIHCWKAKRSPMALYMDSFSELTDQLFRHSQKKWEFCCHYSDLQHNCAFEGMFETLGLLPLNDMRDYYHRFFSFIRSKFGKIPIVFIHFPTVLDKREQFTERYNCILENIDKLVYKFQPFYSIVADDKVVEYPEVPVSGLEDFPYHYSEKTYEHFVEAVKNTGVFSNQCK